MKYKVTTSYLVSAGDMSHDDEWLFDTREEAQKFVDKFYEAFPKDTFRDCYSMDYPVIDDEIEEIDDADPYAWLEEQIKYKEEHIKKYGR